MRFLIVTGLILVFALTGCEMPGAGQVTEQVEGQFNSIKEQVEDLTTDNEQLAEQIEALQEQFDTGNIEMPDLSNFDIDEITESLDEELEGLTARTDSLLNEFDDLLETQSLSIDSLKNHIDDLEGEIASLRNTVNNYNSSGSGGRTGDSSGGRTGDTSGGGRGGSTGGSTGGR